MDEEKEEVSERWYNDDFGPLGEESFLSLKQLSQTLTGRLIPKWGKTFVFEEQLLQNVWPHFLQWCFRVVIEKDILHLIHTGLSFHSGGVWVSKKSTLIFGSGGKTNPNRGMEIIIH